VDQASIFDPGTSWTQDYSSAVNYRNAAPDRRIKFMDVPYGELGPQAAHVGTGREFRFAPEVAERFKPTWMDELFRAGERGAGSPRMMLGMGALGLGGLGLDALFRKEDSLVGQLLGWGG
jgi:hypothetical protein